MTKPRNPKSVPLRVPIKVRVLTSRSPWPVGAIVTATAVCETPYGKQWECYDVNHTYSLFFSDFEKVSHT